MDKVPLKIGDSVIFIDISKMCNLCGELMVSFGEGYYCDKGFFKPGQSVTTGGIEPTESGYKKSQVVIVRPQDCIEAEKIYQIKHQEMVNELRQMCSSVNELRQLSRSVIDFVFTED